MTKTNLLHFDISALLPVDGALQGLTHAALYFSFFLHDNRNLLTRCMQGRLAVSFPAPVLATAVPRHLILTPMTPSLKRN